MKREFTTREKVLLLVLIVIVIAAGYYWLVYTPVENRILEARAEETNYQDQILMEMVRTKQLKEMREALSSQNTESEGPMSVIPDYDNLEYVMVQLDAILTPAINYSLTFSDVVPSDKLISRPIEMTFACDSYNTARNIMNNLYSCMYRCTIDHVTMTAGGGEREGVADLNQDPVSVSLTVTFYEKYPAETEAGEAGEDAADNGAAAESGI